jgi:hypothetical protein
VRTHMHALTGTFLHDHLTPIALETQGVERFHASTCLVGTHGPATWSMLRRGLNSPARGMRATACTTGA